MTAPRAIDESIALRGRIDPAETGGDVHVVAFSDFCADPDRLSPETNSASRFA
jgi:hypothetical protein